MGRRLLALQLLGAMVLQLAVAMAQQQVATELQLLVMAQQQAVATALPAAAMAMWQAVGTGSSSSSSSMPHLLLLGMVLLPLAGMGQQLGATSNRPAMATGSSNSNPHSKCTSQSGLLSPRR
jgi:hypothetical protein